MTFLKKIIPFLFLVLIWQLLISYELANELILPSPTTVWHAFVRAFTVGELYIDIAQSVHRVLVGFLSAAFLGVLIGLWAGYSKCIAFFVTPLCELLRPIPPIAWIPIAILWFGLGNAPAYFIVFVGSFFPIFINTFLGVKTLRLNYINVARNFGASSPCIFSDVVIPGSAAHIMRGLRIGLGLAWTSVISAELVGAQNGLGYMIQMNRIMLKTQNVIVGMITIGIIGLIMNYGMALLERKLTFWNRETIEYI